MRNYCENTQLPFKVYEPVEWTLGNASDGIIVSVRCNHGIKGNWKLHNLKDSINEGRSLLEKVLIEYRIKNISYGIYTVSDMFEAGYSFDENSAGNIMGDLAERISRRITKYFLKHYSRDGKTGGIFNKRFDRTQSDDFIVANTSEYILKIKKYPHLIILKKSGKGKYGYENIKELDGFFDYRFKGKRYILVLESKLENINIDCDALLNNLFSPLRALFPDTSFYYILFTENDSLYYKKNFEKRRQIKQVPLKIYRRLKQAGIGTLFFYFNESRQDFERMTYHLITQYRIINKMGVTIYGKSIITENECAIFDGGETPHIKLVKDPVTGLWREVHLSHKRK